MNTMNPRHPGQACRQARRAANLSLVDLAEKTGYGRGQIQRFEQNERGHINFPLLQRICIALGLSWTDILNRWDHANGS